MCVCVCIERRGVDRAWYCSSAPKAVRSRENYDEVMRRRWGKNERANANANNGHRRRRPVIVIWKSYLGSARKSACAAPRLAKTFAFPALFGVRIGGEASEVALQDFSRWELFTAEELYAGEDVRNGKSVYKFYFLSNFS